MIPVARGAGWRAQVPANGHGLAVDAGGVVGELIGGDFVCLHVIGICVAMGASRCDVQGMNFRSWIAGSPQVMHAVTIGADRNFGVALGEELSVHAGLILTELIGP